MIIQLYLKKDEVEELSALQHELMDKLGTTIPTQRIIKAILRKFLFEELANREVAVKEILKILNAEKKIV